MSSIKILQETLLNTPSQIIDLYEADFSTIKGAEQEPIHRFFSGTNYNYSEIKFTTIENAVPIQHTYLAAPIEVTGFEWNGSGQLPSPKLSIANINGSITVLNLLYQDLLGLKITRIRTMLKYLDAVNFAEGTNSSADPTAKFPDEVFFIDRKSVENASIVEYDLVSALDISSVKLPRRIIIQNMCTWKYTDPDTCTYIVPPTGGPWYNEFGIQVDSKTKDSCGKKLSDCKLRFNSNDGIEKILNYGGFPGAGLSN